eukprot:scaffold2258_cov144-Skeletonema_menzelii.AAC.14
MTRKEQSIVHLHTLKNALPQVRQAINTMSLECEQIEIKTKSFKERFHKQLTQYHQARAKLEDLEESAQKREENVKALTEQFEQLSNELDEVKKQIHDKGKSMTDSTPLFDTQRAIQRLREENRYLDQYIGVLYHKVTLARQGEDDERKDEDSDEDVTC